MIAVVVSAPAMGEAVLDQGQYSCHDHSHSRTDVRLAHKRRKSGHAGIATC